jgi:hypothetical protein
MQRYLIQWAPTEETPLALAEVEQFPSGACRVRNLLKRPWRSDAHIWHFYLSWGAVQREYLRHLHDWFLEWQDGET